MKKMRVILALVLVLATCLSLTACGSGSSSYKAAVKNYFNALIGDLGALKKNTPDFVVEYAMDEDDIDKDEYWEEKEEYLEDMVDYLEDEYGKNLKVKVKFEDADKMDKDDLEDYEEYLQELYDNDDIKVTAGYTVEGEATIKGKDDDDTDDFELNVYKINGKWYVR